MNIVDKFHEGLKSALSGSTPISRDSYEAWLDNEVTQRFMAEMAINLSDAYREPIFGDAEQILKAVHTRNEAIKNFEEVFSWKPIELETTEKNADE